MNPTQDTTPPMAHMIKHNSLAIPEDGLAMLRLFSLGDWHTHSEYDHLASIDDEEVRPFVAEFDQMRRRSRRECEEEMSDKNVTNFGMNIM
eukprot:CAMPEP_0195338966 /NCGR_PEP_ID=MMETSP0708-20121125/17910_1 /TAXON_ID=33640 /ORGANISM="Asterionellopsis glacialis, Strain CCMP134" /LENGTH=90 /DNA_ID=CAMNT_0040410461 /DNA_START=84 /DNA_END=357 /DNA_ORIENTATION=+